MTYDPCSYKTIHILLVLPRLYLNVTFSNVSHVGMDSMMSSNNPTKLVPALAPPAGVIPNFVNPYSLAPAFVVTAVLCLLLATSAVIVRLAISFSGPTKRIRIEDCTFLSLLELSLPNVVTAHADMARYLCYIMGRQTSCS